MFIQNNKLIDFLSAPSVCDCCGSGNIEIKSVINNSNIWKCRECEASVTCHAGTEIPMGKMADSETRMLRVKAHASFDQLWKSGLLSRQMAYKWLAAELKIRLVNCHISWLTKDQIEIAIARSTIFYEERKQFAKKRIIKKQKAVKRLNKTIKKHIRDRKRR